MDAHRLAEERSLAYHRVIAGRLRSDPAVLEAARRRVSAWREAGVVPFYAAEWDRVLAGTVDSVCATLVSETEEARALRQSTPFAGFVSPRERWRIWRETRGRTGAP
ncbi:MAG: hypothetical protein JOZ69_18365 [Myxococcales bacterium]|nr:hypothetical protein [Myxococcales bacterium]